MFYLSFFFPCRYWFPKSMQSIRSDLLYDLLVCAALISCENGIFSDMLSIIGRVHRKRLGGALSKYFLPVNLFSLSLEFSWFVGEWEVNIKSRFWQLRTRMVVRLRCIFTLNSVWRSRFRNDWNFFNFWVQGMSLSIRFLETIKTDWQSNVSVVWLFRQILVVWNCTHEVEIMPWFLCWDFQMLPSSMKTMVSDLDDCWFALVIPALLESDRLIL